MHRLERLAVFARIMHAIYWSGLRAVGASLMLSTYYPMRTNVFRIRKWQERIVTDCYINVTTDEIERVFGVGP